MFPMHWLRAQPRGARLGFLAAITLAALSLVASLPPIPQPAAYHQFADQRAFLGVPNFLNVASNAALLLAGLAGLAVLRQTLARRAPAFARRFECWPYAVFFAGALLTGLGSTYYHWAPDNARLVWDRLPMAVTFTAFLAAAIAERIDAKAGVALLAPFVLLGAASVVYWHIGELRGAGDLRPYGFVQFHSALSIALIVPLFASRYTRGADVLAVLGLYALAMLCGELLDQAIFEASRIVSGHTLKHLIAGAAVLWVARMLRGRGASVDP